MKAKVVSLIAIVCAISACGVSPKNGSASDSQASLAAARNSTTVKKSGMYQLSLLTCTVPAQTTLPESLDIPSKFEVFFDAGALMGGATGDIASTVLLEMPDVKTRRAIVEGTLKTNADGTVRINYSVKSMDGSTKSIVIATQGAGAEKATLKLASDTVSYECVANAQ